MLDSHLLLAMRHPSNSFKFEDHCAHSTSAANGPWRVASLHNMPTSTVLTVLVPTGMAGERSIGLRRSSDLPQLPFGSDLGNRFRVRFLIVVSFPIRGKIQGSLSQ